MAISRASPSPTCMPTTPPAPSTSLPPELPLRCAPSTKPTVSWRKSVFRMPPRRRAVRRRAGSWLDGTEELVQAGGNPVVAGPRPQLRAEPAPPGVSASVSIDRDPVDATPRGLNLRTDSDRTLEQSFLILPLILLIDVSSCINKPFRLHSNF